jgi:hypothetical protein
LYTLALNGDYHERPRDRNKNTVSEVFGFQREKGLGCSGEIASQASDEEELQYGNLCSAQDLDHKQNEQRGPLSKNPPSAPKHVHKVIDDDHDKNVECSIQNTPAFLSIGSQSASHEEGNPSHRVNKKIQGDKQGQRHSVEDSRRERGEFRSRERRGIPGTDIRSELQDANDKCGFCKEIVNREAGIYHAKSKHKSDIRDAKRFANNQKVEYWVYN